MWKTILAPHPTFQDTKVSLSKARHKQLRVHLPRPESDPVLVSNKYYYARNAQVSVISSELRTCAYQRKDAFATSNSVAPPFPRVMANRTWPYAHGLGWPCGVRIHRVMCVTMCTQSLSIVLDFERLEQLELNCMKAYARSLHDQESFALEQKFSVV